MFYGVIFRVVVLVVVGVVGFGDEKTLRKTDQNGGAILEMGTSKLVDQKGAVNTNLVVKNRKEDLIIKNFNKV